MGGGGGGGRVSLGGREFLWEEESFYGNPMGGGGGRGEFLAGKQGRMVDSIAMDSTVRWGRVNPWQKIHFWMIMFEDNIKNPWSVSSKFRSY